MSGSFEWSPAFSVAHRGLDRQHQRLFKMCATVSECATGKLSNEAFHRVLNDLAEYSRDHIDFEEGILKSCSYPYLNDHHKEHDDFMLRMLGYVQDSMKGTVNRQQLANYAWSWWRDHVLVNDMQYKPWLQEHMPEAC